MQVHNPVNKWESRKAHCLWLFKRTIEIKNINRYNIVACILYIPLLIYFLLLSTPKYQELLCLWFKFSTMILNGGNVLKDFLTVLKYN